MQFVHLLPRCCIPYGCRDAHFIAPDISFSLLRHSAEQVPTDLSIRACFQMQGPERHFNASKLLGIFQQFFCSLCCLLWTRFSRRFASLLWALCHRFSGTSSGPDLVSIKAVVFLYPRQLKFQAVCFSSAPCLRFASSPRQSGCVIMCF